MYHGLEEYARGGRENQVEGRDVYAGLWNIGGMPLAAGDTSLSLASGPSSPRHPGQPDERRHRRDARLKRKE
jgi:hypothetical protein